MLTRRCSTATIAGAICAGGMPCHTDEEWSVIAVIGRPPFLAVGHQGGDIVFQRLVIDRVEGFGIIEIIAVWIWAFAVFGEDIDLRRLRPPIGVASSEQIARSTISVEGATAHFTCLGIHRILSFLSLCTDSSGHYAETMQFQV